MSYVSPEMRAKFDEITGRYPRRQAAVIPLLHLVQEAHGSLPAEAQREVAEYLGIPAVKVQEVVSFYSMFTEKPRGRHHLMVCRTLSCALGGFQEVSATVERVLCIRHGQVTADGMFSVEEVECLAACDMGPVMQVGDTLHGHLDAGKTEALIEELKKR